MKIVALLLLFSVSACEDNFDPPSLLARSRILGLAFSVEGDPDRTDPLRGETVDLRVLWAFPNEPLPLSFQGIACVALQTGFGVPTCDPDFGVIAELEANAPAGDMPVLTLRVPDDFPEGRELLLFGGTCAGGPVDTLLLPADGSFDTSALDVCERPEDTGELLQTTLPIPIDIADANRSPSLLVDMTLAGQPLATGNLQTGDACSERKDLPLLRVGGPRVALVVSASPESLEPLTPEGDVNPENEVLQVGLMITSGEANANFLLIEADDLIEDTTIRPAREAERSPGSDGSIERIILSVRDGRGGLVVQDVAYCLLEAEP
ncbi:MAG: hypothetical protein AAF355_06755 [Myxococcota bacterium]